ncbi:MAG: type III-B CRISPR module-associated protein Cmr5 [Thermodesulfobacteriota bacterium]|nr:type III-B CRISPR module-associated protein Cmr5 [Thermodesulfobacteriota bacterium]
MRTLGQKRAAFALEKVTGMAAETKERFEPFSAGAPSMILQNGFGQALAFWLSKGKGEHMAMFNIVQEWLTYQKEDVKNDFVQPNDDSPTAFIKAISGMPQQEYLTAQKETLALIEWVKRYAKAGL